MLIYINSLENIVVWLCLVFVRHLMWQEVIYIYIICENIEWLTKMCCGENGELLFTILSEMVWNEYGHWNVNDIFICVNIDWYEECEVHVW